MTLKAFYIFLFCRRVVFVFFLLILPFFSFSQGTFNSNTPAAAAWNLASSWTLISGSDADGIPDGDDDVTILATHTINFTVSASCNNITIIGTLAMNTLSVTLTANANLTMDAAAVISGSSNNTKDIVVNGNFIVLATGTATAIQGFDFSVAGTSTINGSINFPNTTGTRTLTGDITISGTGTWNSTANAVFTFGGSITNNGTFTSGTGTYTLTGAGKTLGGSSSITFSGILDISGSYTNNGTLTVGTDLTGAGSLTQGVGSSLLMGDDVLITTLTATAVPNTITYNGTGTQDVKGTTYHHLTIDKSASSAQFNGSSTINGNLTINRGTLLSDNLFSYTHTVLGSTSILAGAPGGVYSINTNTSVLNVQDLTMNGGSISSGDATSTVNVATTFTVTGAASTISGCNFTVTGAATINAPVTFSSDNGVKTFQSLVTVNAGGSWTSTSIFTTANLDFRNGIVSNGTLFSAQDATFSTNSQNISGGTALTFGDNVTISGAITVTNQVTTSISITGDLIGTVAGSTWKNDPSTRLNYGNFDAPMLTGVLDVSALGNVVNYNLGGSQGIRVPLTTYYHLELTVSGTKTFQGSTTASGNLTLSGSAASNAGAGFTHTVSGTTFISGTANLNHNSSTVSVYNLTNLELTTTGGTNVGNSAGTAGTTNVSGTFLVNAGTSFVTRCHFNVTGASTVNGDLTIGDIQGIKTFIGAVTVGAGGSWTSTGVTGTTGVVFRGGIASGGTSFSAGGATFNTNPQTISGSTALSFANIVTVTGVVVTNNTTVNMTNIAVATLTGTGTWTQGASSTLNYSGATIPVAITLNASASGNTVNYNQAGAQTIFHPSGGTYFHLTASGSGTKTASAGTKDVNGNLSIQGTAVLDAGANAVDILLAGNWSNSSSAADPFVEGTRTVTFDGTGTQTITRSVAPPETFYNLTSATTGGGLLQLGSDVTTANLLTMTSGIYNLNAFTLTLGSSAVASTLTRAVSSTTNWMYGGTFKRFWLDATAISSTAAPLYGLFPMGTSAASSYRPLEINTTVSPTTGGFFTVNHVATTGALDLSPFYNDAGTNIERIVNAQFITAVSGVVGGTYNIDATMTGLQAGTLSDIRLAIFTGGTTASAVGTHAGAAGSAPNPTAKRTGVTQAELNNNNDFRISTANAAATPLPVVWLSFDAVLNGNAVDVTWSTGSEYNNDYFTVEKSQDGINFIAHDTLDGAGFSSIQKNYFMQDTDPYSGISFYRIKQTDFNGQSTYTNAIAVNFSGIEVISFHPDASGNIGTFLVNSSEDMTVWASITDMTGKRTNYFSQYIPKGVTEVNVDISVLSQAVYVFRVISDNGKYQSEKQFVR